MKKFHELTNREARDIIVGLSAELKILIDDEMKEILREYQDAQKGKETNMTLIDIVQRVIDSLLIKNEDSLWRVISLIAQCTTDEAENLNNAETVEMVVSFFSIDQYKRLFSSAIKSATRK